MMEDCRGLKLIPLVKCKRIMFNYNVYWRPSLCKLTISGIKQLSFVVGCSVCAIGCSLCVFLCCEGPDVVCMLFGFLCCVGAGIAPCIRCCGGKSNFNFTVEGSSSRIRSNCKRIICMLILCRFVKIVQ